MNFDHRIDRSQYPTMKWSRDFLDEHFGNPDAIPMSVADMDLPAPPAVIEALKDRAAHGIYGYESRPDSYFEALTGWYRDRHGWPLERGTLEEAPSILNAISVLLDLLTEPGDGVIVQPPVFFEFRMVIRANGRKIIKNPLQLVDGQYRFDLDDLEAKAAEPENKVLILCNPHNPVGRVWTREELAQVADICARHDVFVISDEIHGDFAFPPHRYTPYLLAAGENAAAAACISPGKTFNISGLVDAMAVIPDPDLRSRFRDFAHRFQINKANVFSIAAIEAGYRDRRRLAGRGAGLYPRQQPLAC